MPPGVNTTSFTGWPESTTSRPPMWNEPMSRNANWACEQPASNAAETTSAFFILPPGKNLELVLPQSAIHRNDRAGDVARTGGGEEDGQVGEVLRLAIFA